MGNLSFLRVVILCLTEMWQRWRKPSRRLTRNLLSLEFKERCVMLIVWVKKGVLKIRRLPKEQHSRMVRFHKFMHATPNRPRFSKKTLRLVETQQLVALLISKMYLPPSNVTTDVWVSLLTILAN